MENANNNTKKDNNKNFYITTPIYYVNGDPHVGTAYSTIATDVMARYKKTIGNDVYFLTGTDEHGQKVEETANEKGYTPQEWTDMMSVRFVEMWKTLNIDNDDFIRTTENRHILAVQKILNAVYEKGDIYKGDYEGNYCVSCETFFPANQIEDNKCPDCGKELRVLKEETYFFRMSKYQDQLLEHIEKNPNFIIPVSRRNEVISFIKQGLHDLSISRNTFQWGIPIKFAKGHITYVWFDALTNYITAVGYESDPVMFDKYWNNAHVVNLIGKDILRFHAIIWPCMLMSAGIKIPDNIVAHGWWTSEGEKMSKSKGNVVSPVDETNKYGVDAFRYYLLRDTNFGNDGDYSTKAIVNRINSELANDLGNLLNRTLGMYKKYFSGIVEVNRETKDTDTDTDTDIDNQIKKMYKETVDLIDNHMNYFEFAKSLEAIWRFISRLNKYIDETAPWTLQKDVANKERLAEVMNILINGLCKIAVLIYPYMPDASQQMWNQLGIKKDIKEAKIKDVELWNLFEKDHILGEATPIFPRIEIEEDTDLAKNKENNIDKKEVNLDLEITNPVDIKEFNKFNFQVVEIIDVEKVKGADKLLKFKVSLGDSYRQILSGIAKYYPDLEKLKGKKCMAVTNLAITKIRGEISQGMLLTTENSKDDIRIIEIDDTVLTGSFIK